MITVTYRQLKNLAERKDFGLATDKLAPADFDGDGKTDIAVWREGALSYF